MKFHGIAFLLIWSCSLIACKDNDIERIRVLEKENELPVESGTNVVLYYSDSACLKAKVMAPVLLRYEYEERRESVMPKGITVYFFEKDGSTTSSLRSKYAIRDERMKKIIAKKDVLVINVKGDTLRSDELVWEENTGKIYTEKAVSVRTKGRIIFGQGLETNAQFSPYTFHKVTGSLDIKE